MISYLQFLATKLRGNHGPVQLMLNNYILQLFSMHVSACMDKHASIVKNNTSLPRPHKYHIQRMVATVNAL